ncbi:hypothetical protein VNO78_33307 [Psophocarpus tetragonolobus]|uniref:F-box domain-containing protein n=1 Tax=Psophocarpus tetragonolobus TaxID=3891 RepID=A0AAN9P1X7_PSOTE
MSLSPVVESQDLLIEILLRLPSKPLAKFKCVSKQWLTLITSHHFITLYSSLHHFPLLLSHSPLNYTFSISTFHTPIFQTPFTFDFLNLPKHGSLHIIQACKGLLLIQTTTSSSDSFCTLYVCNPTTKSFITLGDMSEFDAALTTFFLAIEHPSSSHFKVVAIKRSIVSPLVHCISCNLIASCTIYEISIYSSETASWGNPFSYCNTTPTIEIDHGVYCNGALHWYSVAQESFYFDIKNQSFKMYPMPPEIKALTQQVEYFGQSGEHLHLILQAQGRLVFHIFELEQDYSYWSKKFLLDFSPMLSFNILGLIRQEKEEEFLLVFLANDAAFSCNLDNATFRELYELRSTIQSCDKMCSLRQCFKLFEYFENFSSIGGLIG